jgi:two-component system chemotaxis sensor kinase CheA
MEMNQYLDMFIEESKECLQAINHYLLEVEKEPMNLSAVDEIFRLAHTLKGMSATMGFADIARLTHEIENVLDWVRNGQVTISDHMMDTLFKSIDALEEIIYSTSVGGDGSTDISLTIRRLQQAVETHSLRQEAASASEVGDARNELDLDEYQTAVFKQAIQGGYTALWVQPTIREDCVLPAVRAYMVLDSLQAHGQIIKSIPSIEEIEKGEFDQNLCVLFVTQTHLHEVEQTVLRISEIEAVDVRELTLGQVVPPPTEEHSSHIKRLVGGETIRVDITRLDVLMDLSAALVIDRDRLEQLARELNHPPLMETVEHMSRTCTDLQKLVLSMRMVPVKQIFNRFPRMVRDLAKGLQKQVNLVIEGAKTELDRTVIDGIGEALVHLLRNAVDHGLESAGERIQAGKPPAGTILLKAYHSGKQVMIEVKDDGKGIDRSKVLKKALERGIVEDRLAATLSDEQVFALLFASGFSTAEAVSDVSGRGVGLDVVKTKIYSLGGEVSVVSIPGQGTTFLIQLPLTLQQS